MISSIGRVLLVCAAFVVPAFGRTLPPEPVSPTKYEHCKPLEQSYHSLIRETSQAHGQCLNQWSGKQGSGGYKQIEGCGAGGGATVGQCVGLKQQLCQLRRQQLRAVGTCRNRVRAAQVLPIMLADRQRQGYDQSVRTLKLWNSARGAILPTPSNTLSSRLTRQALDFLDIEIRSALRQMERGFQAFDRQNSIGVAEYPSEAQLHLPSRFQRWVSNADSVAQREYKPLSGHDFLSTGALSALLPQLARAGSFEPLDFSNGIDMAGMVEAIGNLLAEQPRTDDASDGRTERLVRMRKATNSMMSQLRAQQATKSEAVVSTKKPPPGKSQAKPAVGGSRNYQRKAVPACTYNYSAWTECLRACGERVIRQGNPGALMSPNSVCHQQCRKYNNC
jgi:hypothetical protein